MRIAAKNALQQQNERISGAPEDTRELSYYQLQKAKFVVDQIQRSEQERKQLEAQGREFEEGPFFK